MAAERPAEPIQPNMQRWLPIVNASDSPIPPGGACRVTGVTSDGALTVARPDTDGQANVLFNGRVPVAVGGVGRATMSWPAMAAYDADPLDGEGPSHGEAWGTEAGSWALQSGQVGFLVLGDGVDGLCNVVPDPGSGTVTGTTTFTGIVNFAITSILNFLGATWNFLANTVWSIAEGVTLEIKGPGTFQTCAPFVICGDWYLCRASVPVTGDIVDLSVPETEDDVPCGYPVIRLTGTPGPFVFHSLTSRGDRMTVGFINSTSDRMVLKHDSGTGTASKWKLRNGKDMAVQPGGCFLAHKENEVSGWRVLTEVGGPLTSKGDLFVNDGSVDDRLAAGANNSLLTPDSSTALGLKWFGPGSANQILGMNAAGDGLEWKTLAVDHGITITHGAGTITFDNTCCDDTYLVQHAYGTTNSGTSLTVNWPAATTTGNLLVAVVTLRNTSANPAGPTPPAGWSLAVTDAVDGSCAPTSAPNRREQIAIFYLAAAASQSTSPAFTFSSGTCVSVFLLELAITNGAPADVNTFANASSTSPSVGPTATTAQASEVVIAGFVAAGAVTYSVPTNGFAIVDQATDASNTQSGAVLVKTLSAIDAPTAGATIGSACWVGAIATFKV